MLLLIKKCLFQFLCGILAALFLRVLYLPLGVGIEEPVQLGKLFLGIFAKAVRDIHKSAIMLDLH